MKPFEQRTGCCCLGSQGKNQQHAASGGHGIREADDVILLLPELPAREAVAEGSSYCVQHRSSGNHAQQFGFRQNRNAEFLCAGEFGAGVSADEDVVDILADAGGDLAAMAFDQAAGVFT